jgi:hypothetical protein
MNLDLRVLEWLRREWMRDRTCPLCGSQTWSLSPQAYELDERLPAAGAEQQAIVVAVLCCDTCAYTMLLNAKVMNVLNDGRAADVPSESRDAEQ